MKNNKPHFLAIAIFSTTLTLAFGLEPCPQCGNFSIPYPLSTDSNCGEPEYQLSCNNQVLEFESPGGNSHKVLSIDPSSYKLTISPPPIVPGSCIGSDLNEGGFVINDSSPFAISNKNTVLLFNCSQTMLLSPLNCSSRSICREVEKSGFGFGCGNTLCCSYLKDSPSMSRRIRIRTGVCTAYTSLVALDETEPVRSWKFGIELQWTPFT